jgi:leader peptidase (prepilin peptidase)/N-methyltransferase
MTFFSLLQSNPILFTVVASVIGLLVGSFLNVVIYRLPVMLEKSWRSQCTELLELPETGEQNKQEPFNIVTPRSKCPHCGHKIRAWENIPVISYLVLRGKCASCKNPISIRYPIIELVTGVLSAIVAWHFGFGWAATGALLLTWALIALSVIDIDHQILPDNITLPFLWLGLFLAIFGIFTDSHSSIIGALAGYLSLWLVYHAFKFLTGKEGMGFGDFKLLAMLGAWMGWHSLPIVILMSSLVGAVTGIAMILILGRDRNLPIPFGPYLAAAGWITLLWGNQFMDYYLSISGLK